MEIQPSFELQPRLRGELIELRPLQPSDYDSLYAVARDPLIWEQHPNSDRWQEPVFRKFFEGGLACGGALLASAREDGRVVGSSRFYGLDEAAGVVEIGWSFLARTCWGGAWNGEMKRLMVMHAHRFVPRVLFRVGPHNLRSQHALRKIGAQPAGTGTDSGSEPCLIFEIRRAQQPPAEPHP